MILKLHSLTQTYARQAGYTLAVDYSRGVQAQEVDQEVSSMSGPDLKLQPC